MSKPIIPSVVLVLLLLTLLGCLNGSGGKGLTSRNTETATPQDGKGLIEAARADDLKRITELLSSGANPNARDFKGYTPLMVASLRGNADVIEALVVAGANVNAVNDAGSTPLKMAIEGRQALAVRTLIKHQADIGLKYYENRTVLHYAVETSEKDVVAMLLAAGADVNARDDLGESLRPNPGRVSGGRSPLVVGTARRHSGCDAPDRRRSGRCARRPCS